MIDQVKHIILVLSGKGGVGKSTVSVQLSLLLRERGLKVGLLDIDLCGPSIPHLLDLEDDDVHQGPDGWIPVYIDEEQTLGVMSIGFLLKSKNDSIVWRGAKKSATIGQFITDVNWGSLDYLIIDTPPGTSDEHITIIEKLREFRCDGAILVTTPQRVSLEDVRKEYTLCRKTGLPVIGLIENMSGYTCPNCKECTKVFSSDGGRQFAELESIPFLGKLPIDFSINNVANRKQSIVVSAPSSAAADVFNSIVDSILKT